MENQENQNQTENQAENQNQTQTTSNSSDSKSKIVLSYIFSFLGLIFVFTEKNATDAEKRNYAQAGTIFIITLIISVVTGIINLIGIPFVGAILSLLPTVLFVFCIIAAVKSSRTEVYQIPLIFDLSKKFFK